MCGISGYIGDRKLNSSNKNQLFNLMKNRGPDSHGHKKIVNKNNSINLFFTRLAILGPQNNSNQPFEFKDKIIIFNGEIYNYIEIRNKLIKYGYRFNTNSDTEVLIKALDKWGIQCIKKLEGMWSFFYYDAKKNISYLCRDRFGEKPLFYMRKQNEFYFGSEIKFLKCLYDKKLLINHNKLEKFLKYGYKSIHKDNATNYKDVLSVPSGHYLKINGNKIEKFRYWKISPKINYLNEKDYFLNLKEKLFKAIEIRLRSDFPIAFFLSGGIDSNALAFISKYYFNYKMKTYSIIGTDPKYDESKMINLANKNLCADHSNLSINLKKMDFIDTLKEQINYHDSPVTTINSLLNFLLYKEVKKDGFKVSISGIGSDEIFSGYYDHHLLYLNEIKNKKKLFKDSSYNWEKIVLPLVRNPFLRKKKLYLNNPKFRKHIYQHEKFKNSIFKNNLHNNFSENKYCKSLMKNRMINEMLHEIVPVVLKEEDLNGMYHSIENRSPFLDTNLFQAGLNMPSEMYIKNGLAKWPLRQIIKNIVPDKIRLNSRKIGFNASIKDIFKINSKNINYLIEDNEIFNIIDKKQFKKLIQTDKNFTGVQNNFIFNFLSVKLFLDNEK
tara:strand:- start:5504 stop:7330 length:1827 start_codon:yes stop_codon:yes gene_type:complete